VAAAALGVDVRRQKIRVFVLSAVFASVAGSLYAHYFGYVNPDTFSIFKSLDLVIMVVVGGLGSVWGTLFGRPSSPSCQTSWDFWKPTRTSSTGDPGGDPPLFAPGVRVRTGGYHPHPLGPPPAGHGPAIVKLMLMRLIR